jgi:Actinobacteria/chloroflexi VLRF1 release factor
MENGQSGTPRWLDIGPDRVAGWLDGFASRHGGATTEPGPEIVTVRAADGAVAECHPPFPPLPAGTRGTGAELAVHACADRTVGVLLVRLGGYAAGVFAGRDARLVASKVGSRLVHGRSAAGGTSQHRFARRREKQASEALAAAADCAVGVFGAFGAFGRAEASGRDSGGLDAVVLGGDKRAMAVLREDVRLRPYFALAVDRFLTVPDPRLTVLQATPRAFRAIRIRLTEN